MRGAQTAIVGLAMNRTALQQLRDADAVLNPARWQNWLTVQGWNEESRYHP